MKKRYDNEGHQENQGRHGVKHALLGSTTERVVRHAPSPVLVVRQR
jgi:nucleotide-binding universal stress UspA family protein